jgi:hypothetical protein
VVLEFLESRLDDLIDPDIVFMGESSAFQHSPAALAPTSPVLGHTSAPAGVSGRGSAPDVRGATTALAVVTPETPNFGYVQQPQTNGDSSASRLVITKARAQAAAVFNAKPYGPTPYIEGVHPCPLCWSGTAVRLGNPLKAPRSAELLPTQHSLRSCEAVMTGKTFRGMSVLADLSANERDY